MKKILFGILLTGLSLIAADGRALSSKCVACHGVNFEKAALGKSAIVNGQSASDIYASLVGYKQGTRNTAGMGALMKGQVAAMSNNDMWAVAEYVASLSEQAAPAAEAEPANDWPYVCEQPDIKQFGSDRYFFVSDSDNYPLIVADKKSIKIDKKNKVIQVWTIWLVSPTGREYISQKYGSQFSQYGYMKRLDTIKYGSMVTEAKAFTEHECNGNVISSNTFNKAEPWVITPDSTMEGIVESIKKQYNLK